MKRFILGLFVAFCAGCQCAPSGRSVQPEREATIEIEAPPGDLKSSKVVIKVSTKF